MRNTGNRDQGIGSRDQGSGNKLALPLKLVLLATLTLALPHFTQAQTTNESATKNAAQARAALNTMVQALGGQAWLNQKSQTQQGKVAAFFHGQPSGGTTEYWQIHAWPDQDRIDYGKHRDVAQFYLGRAGTEVTFKGKAPLPQEQVGDWLRRRDHSIETVIKTWLNAPGTILIYQGQRLAGSRLADQVTVISADNDSVTLQMDVETHLPMRRTFEWRDPVYKDRNTDAEEYDDYHSIDGIQTPFTITRYKNDDMTRQFYVLHVAYNQPLAPDTWSLDAAVRRIKK